MDHDQQHLLVSVDAIERARFPLRIAAGAAVDLLHTVPAYALCAQPEPWALIAATAPPPEWLHGVVSVDREALDATVAAVPSTVRCVVGLGGGQALDTAKYVAWRRELPLYQLPSIVSVDAAFTEEIGVREAHRVRYVGNVRPVEVVVDPELVGAAPPPLNRAGVGDILSCQTALQDWRLAVARGAPGPSWDSTLATLGRTLLADLVIAAPSVRAMDDAGIAFLARSLQSVGAGCTAAGHPRFEEGSEHFFAYTFEHLTGEHRIHGELIGLGIVTMASVQGDGAREAASLLNACGVAWTPEHLGIDQALFDRVLAELPGYCVRERLMPSVVEIADLGPAKRARHWAVVRGLATTTGA